MSERLIRRPYYSGTPSGILCQVRNTRPIAAGRDDHCAAVQFPQTGHSGLPEHFLVLSICDADRADSGYNHINSSRHFFGKLQLSNGSDN